MSAFLVSGRLMKNYTFFPRLLFLYGVGYTKVLKERPGDGLQNKPKYVA
jgi:hypothetical protein